MNLKTIYRLLIALTCFIMTERTAFAQSTAAQQWMAGSSWKNGLKLNLHPSTNATEFYAQYQKNKMVWDKVFAFLKTANLDTLSNGQHNIDGDNAYIKVSENPSKDLDKTSWESHQKYIDLQYVIRGKEQIGVWPVAKSVVIKPYNDATDVANYTAEGTFYTAEPGTFFLFFPQDAHRPNIKVPGFDIVKKLVVKIKMVN